MTEDFNNTFTIKAYAKINISLDICGIRDDGYHEVKMVMSQIGLYDELSFTVNDSGIVKLTCDDPNVPIGEDNLIIKAANEYVKRLKPSKSIGVDIFLEKNIPMSAGLAGGSTDAAAVIRGMNSIYGNALSESDLLEIGGNVGSDIPFCIVGGTAYAYGRGEKLDKLSDVESVPIMVIKPSFGVSTKEAYSLTDLCDSLEHPDVEKLKDVMSKGNTEIKISDINKYMINSFEKVIGEKHVEIKNIIDCLKQTNAQKVMMSGSGPTVFAIFNNGDEERMNNIADDIIQEFPDVNVYLTRII